MGSIWIVNDIKSAIPGSKTLWQNLLEWLPDAVWASSGSYAGLATYVEQCYTAAHHTPGMIIRNASYFPHINVDIPQVVLLQDIFRDGPGRAAQIDVCRRAAVVVVNSKYTASLYPEIDRAKIRIIPLPVDFDLFKPDSTVSKLYDFCWIGADSNIKGYDILTKLIGQMTNYKFLVVRKDLPEGRPATEDNVTYCGRMSQATLAATINSARYGLCTSREETQHLAGIEMAGCGLPMLTTNVGAYYSEHIGWNGWRMVVNTMDPYHLDWMADHLPVGGGNYMAVRPNVMAAGFTLEACKSAWLEVVNGLA